MSARYSKTSSRGRSITTCAVTGSIRPRILGRDAPHRDLVLGGAHDLLAARRLAPQWPAQLADQPLAVQEHRLADQRRAMAVHAAAPSRGELAHARAHERDLARRSR